MKLMKFYATWCGPCRKQEEILEGFNDIVVENIDTDDSDNDALIEKYGIRNLPVILLVDDRGEVIKKFVGVTSLEEIKAIITEYEQKQGKD